MQPWLLAVLRDVEVRAATRGVRGAEGGGERAVRVDLHGVSVGAGHAVHEAVGRVLRQPAWGDNSVSTELQL